MTSPIALLGLLLVASASAMIPLVRKPPGWIPANLEAESDGAMDMEQMCERYPWLDHCQGKPAGDVYHKI